MMQRNKIKENVSLLPLSYNSITSLFFTAKLISSNPIENKKEEKEI